MEVTLSGMATLVSPEQLWKAQSPMEVTPSGMVTLVSPEQPAKALEPMRVSCVHLLKFKSTFIEDALITLAISKNL